MVVVVVGLVVVEVVDEVGVVQVMNASVSVVIGLDVVVQVSSGGQLNGIMGSMVAVVVTGDNVTGSVGGIKVSVGMVGVVESDKHDGHWQSHGPQLCCWPR